MEVLGGENYTTASIAHRLIKSLITLKVSELDTHFLSTVKKLIILDTLKNVKK